MENLHDVLIEQLRDLYSAETQLVEALPKMVGSADNVTLKKAFEDHLTETRNQVKRLDQISKAIGEDLTGHVCKAMKGLIKEADESIAEEYEGDGLKDVMLVAAAQRVEHYEIAGYGNAIALADYLGLEEVSALLEETITEEGNADKKLTQICTSELFDQCECDESDADFSEARV